MAVDIFSTLNQITRRRLVFAATIVAGIIVAGAVGFKYFEQFTWLESVYTSAQTVTTVGYGDLAPKPQSSAANRWPARCSSPQ